MPANFKNDLTIDEGRISPSGPLGEELQLAVRKGGHVVVHYWVGQQGAFMQAVGDISPEAPDTWTTRKEGIHHHGKFMAGQAFATAVATIDTAGVMQTQWWSEMIRLTEAPVEKVSGA